MSEINAIGSSKVLTNEKADSKGRETKSKGKLSTAFEQKISQPLRDEFQKKYDTDEITPELLADFTCDKLLKFGVAAATIALVFTKARKCTNGLTKAIKDQFSSATKEAGTKLPNKIRGIIETVKDNNSKIREAAKTAAPEAEQAAKKGGIINTVKNAIFQPTEFHKNSGFSKKISKVFKKPETADKVKNALGKVGIADGYDVVDAAVAVGATGLLTSTTGSITDDVVTSDDKDLAKDAKLQKVQSTLNAVERLADCASAFGI